MTIRICRECKTTSDIVEFKKGKNWCKPCEKAYNKAYKEENADRLRIYRSTPEFKKKRAISVRKCQQKSPESFIKSLIHHVSKYSNYKKKNQKKLNPEALDIQIVEQDLLDLYKKQDGRCAISGIKLTHEFNNLRTMSVDRIDSSKGYLPDNIQLVCQFVNTAKKHYSNDDIVAVLKEAMRSGKGLLHDQS